MAVDNRTRSIVITGCSKGGIGDALAQKFAGQGYRVFATVRNPAKAEHLAAVEGIEVVELDVTSRESIMAASKKIRSGLDNDKLDYLVNNAGMGASGPLIELDLDQARKLLDTNIWGVLAVTQAFKDSLVKAKGKIVNVSSVGAILNIPFIGLYAASKAAVTMLSETLRVELAPFGVGVITAMLGHINTNFHTNDTWSGLADDSMYKSIEKQISEAAAGDFGKTAMGDLDTFIRAFVADIQSTATGQVWRGDSAQAVRFLGYHLPAWMLDMLCPKIGLDVLHKELNK